MGEGGRDTNCVYITHRTRVSRRAGCYIMVITCRAATSARRTYELVSPSYGGVATH